MTRGLPDVEQPDPLTEPVDGKPAKARLLLIDKLRGLVMVLMILDHTRHFFHEQAHLFSPTDLSKTTVALFATRWTTHLCAPTFVFLSGVAVYLQRESGKRGWQLTRFLLIRGLWLIVLELTLVSFAFNFAEPFFFLQVIWAIGYSFILLAAFTTAPPLAVLALGLVIIAGHDVLDAVHAPDAAPWHLIWTLMLQPGRLGTLPGFVAYPALPWFGIMAAGYGAGWLFLEPPARRNRILIASGFALLAGFAALRGLNAYGDPRSWTSGATAALTIMSFLNVAKYPPSLMYALATLGVVLALAPLIERVPGPAGRLLTAFGRTPLFIYLVHLYLIHGLAVLAGTIAGRSSHFLANSTAEPAHGPAYAWGVGLLWVYVIWLGVVLALWPLSTWYGRLKSRRRVWWLSYI